MTKTILLLIVIFIIFTLIGILIPDKFISNIDNALIYFLTSIWNLDYIIDVSTIMTSLKILVSFYFGLSLFWIIHWILLYIK